ncbi:MAG: choice-of-anchor D domain-containing protein, partial [bacterium]
MAQTGATPPSEIALQATSHDYGSAALGEAAEWILAVSNLSTVDLIVSHITSDHADFSAIPATFTVAPGGTREVTVTFAPSSLGSISGSLTIASNDPDESLVHIFLSGEGVQPDATLRVRRGSGTPGSSNNIVAIDLDNNVAVYGVEFNLSYDPDILTVTNVEKTARSAGLRFGMWQESTPGTVYVAYLDIENSIGPGSGPIFDFSFDVEADAPFGNVPLRLLGVSTMDLDTLLNTASVDSFFTVWAPGAAIDVSDMSHDFGVVNVGSSSDWTLTVFNVGLSDLVVSNISSSRTDFSVDITSFNIGSGDSRDVRVTFRP